jgi:acyl-CoA reductase-like NAD-dependent aldehyde dehydrogenase
MTAKQAFETGWAKSDPAWRGSLLGLLADLLEKTQEDILHIEKSFVGISAWWRRQH